MGVTLHFIPPAFFRVFAHGFGFLSGFYAGVSAFTIGDELFFTWSVAGTTVRLTARVQAYVVVCCATVRLACVWLRFVWFLAAVTGYGCGYNILG